MDYSYNYESLDITRLVEQFSGKKLEDLFPNQRIVENQMGEFMELQWEEDDFNCNLNLLKAKKEIFHNLKSVYYIGAKIEEKFTSRGIKTLYDLRPYKRYRKSAI